ncbi:hypothetical protein REPUB_Repub16aG0140500 [Reevesia pubescens]
MPNGQSMKMNVDGSANGQSGLVAPGRVLRDCYDSWLCGFTYRVGIAHILTVEH